MTEDTQRKQVDPDREKLIAEMVRDTESTKVELPSEIAPKTVLNPDDKEAPPTIVRTISSAGYVYVWDSRTYVKVPVLYYMLPQILRQRRQDGSYRFTVNDPGELPKRGTLKCLLHRDSPNRVHYDELGFRICKKENITNPYQVTQHMKSKHKAEWAAIEEEKKERERLEDREAQRLLIGAVAGKVEKPEPVVSIEEPTEVRKAEVFTCPTCNKEYKQRKTFRKHVKACK